jgi:hypothetical protein
MMNDMVRKTGMSRCWLLALAVLLWLPGYAPADETSAAKEIVYRASLGRADDIKLLIQGGASPDQLDENGVPILALASKRNDEESTKVINVLLEAGANINAKDSQGRNPLFYAVKQGNKDMVALLLNHGVDYYAADNSGDIPRNVAFREGHKDIVAMLDNFVIEQTNKIHKQYEEYNRSLEERYKTVEAQDAQYLNDQQRQENATKSKAEEEALKAKEGAEQAEKEALQQLKNIEELRASPQFHKDMRVMAMHACSFEYWSFCRRVKQRSDLSHSAMNDAISTHRQAITDTSRANIKTYHLGEEYTVAILQSVQQRIADLLNDMPSSTYRFEHGICKRADAEERCNELADDWNQAPRERDPAEDYNRTRSNKKPSR